MAVTVESNVAGSVVHAKGTKWIVDDEQNLVVVGRDTKAVAIYARGEWFAAEVSA